MEFSEAFMDYLQQREEFSDEWMQLGMWTDTFEKQVMTGPHNYNTHKLIISHRIVKSTSS